MLIRPRTGRSDPDQQQQTHFILLCHARSGSNLISLSLGKHGAVKMFGEIFHASDLEACASLPKRLHPRHMRSDAAQFLSQEIFDQQPPWPNRARGFKIFYEHARATPTQKAAWTYLIGRKDIKVIHLTRRNLLDCKLSLEVALRNGEWFVSSGEQSSAAPIERFSLSPWDCQQYFGQMLSSRMWAEEAFAGHRTLTLEYERDLCGDFAGTMARVFAFIGVPEVPVAQQLVKQQTGRPADRILNYEELRRWFEHTLHEEYFSAEGAPS